MKIVFLGTVGYYPTENRHTNCVIINDLNIILDAGSGFFRFPEFIDSEKIYILLSHYHIDHICGLTQLLGLFNGRKVEIFGSKGIEDYLNRIFNQPYFSIPISQHPFTIKLKNIGEESFYIDNAKITTQFFHRHSYPVLGYKIESDDKIITYITDTVVGNDEIEFVKNSDLLIHECYYIDRFKEKAKREMHSTAREVAELAKKANCKRVALYHLNPSLKDIYSDFENEAKVLFKNAFIPEECKEIEI